MKPILIREDKEDGYIYACPYCHRYVVRASGLQQCAKCGGMVDNEKTDPWPAKTKMKFDGKESWR